MPTAVLPRRATARPQTIRSAVRRLAVSRFVSMAGTDASGVAIGYALYSQTGSAQWLSLSLMLTIGTAALLAPLGGKAGDLFDRRRLMVGAEIAAAAVFVALAILHTPVALLALGVLAAAIGTIFGPASGAAIAHVAGEERLSWANGLIATSANVGKTAGRLVAGALIAVAGAAGVFVLDAVTFLLSALLIASVGRSFSAPRAPRVPAPERPGTAERRGRLRGRSDGESGMRFLLRERTLRLVVASACISVFATAFSMTAEVPLVFELGFGAVGLGALTASWTAGMIVGGWYAGRALHGGNEATAILAGRLLMSVGIGLVALSPALPPLLVFYLLGGLGGGFMGVAAQSLIMRHTPDHLRARTLGAIDACRNVAFGAGVVGAGALVGVMGPRPVYALVGLAMAVGTLPVATLVMRLGGPRPLRPLAQTAAANA